MTNPSPSAAQIQVLRQVSKGLVWFNSGNWWMAERFEDKKVTGHVRRLWQLGFLGFPKGDLTAFSRPFITVEGLEALATDEAGE